MKALLSELGYRVGMILATLAFVCVGCVFFPVYVITEAWRRRNEGRKDRT